MKFTVILLALVAIGVQADEPKWKLDSVGARYVENWEGENDTSTALRVFTTVQYNKTHYIKFAHTYSGMADVSDSFSSNTNDSSYIEYKYKFK
jgi:hypothetical protein